MLQYIIKYKDKTLKVITDQNKIINTIPKDNDLIGANFNSSLCQKCMTILSRKKINNG